MFKSIALFLLSFMAACPALQARHLAEVNTPAQSRYQFAAITLADDFIGPEEIAAARPGVTYNRQQLKTFEDTLPVCEELVWLHDNGFMLVAGPPEPMSLLGIRELNPEYFFPKTRGWYYSERERFSRDEKATTKWLKLRKDPFPGSAGKSWEEQIALLTDVEYVPNDAEVEWGVTAYKAVRDIYLLPNVLVRTASRDAVVRGHVYMGYFAEKGLHISGYWDSSKSVPLGIASARK